ncbi:HK97 family phage prohead protease [Bifidobacterium miconisargentati]|uniref:HK97 family phage prohead protease n=1 Tax=Bifidobacterium miconisargentati TaxID=2834437 RepID=UPI001BDCAF74|nr:HK97 family phage prohead protease [Bifidobacterium miconisargentati]MBW3090428.1 HK97 family phage prohead protease [Bifidobacterium miconisargentati]
MTLDHRGFEFKEAPNNDDARAGVFSGYASTWDKDLYDDVIVQGAFEQTLANDFRDGGAGIPIHWQHKDGSPNDIIGETLSAVEDEHGLLVTARLDTDIPEGKRAYDLLKRGLIHQMSIGFIAEKTAWVEDEESKSPWDGYREIRQVKLFEISLVQVAANQGAEVLEVKAGSAISKANESKIRVAYDALGELLDAITDTPDDEPDSDGDDGKTADSKDFDPAWVREFNEISDFLSLANH